MTIHRADGNASADRQRRALGFVYYAQRAGKDTEAASEYSKELHDDLARDGKI